MIATGAAVGLYPLISLHKWSCVIQYLECIYCCSQHEHSPLQFKVATEAG